MKMITNTAQAFPKDFSNGLEKTRIFAEQGALVREIRVFNHHGSTLYLQIFDKASVPTAGEVPVLVKAIATKVNDGFDFGSDGCLFENGVVAALSSDDDVYADPGGNYGLFFGRWK